MPRCCPLFNDSTTPLGKIPWRGVVAQELFRIRTSIGVVGLASRLFGVLRILCRKRGGGESVRGGSCEHALTWFLYITFGEWIHALTCRPVRTFSSVEIKQAATIVFLLYIMYKSCVACMRGGKMVCAGGLAITCPLHVNDMFNCSTGSRYRKPTG